MNSKFHQFFESKKRPFLLFLFDIVCFALIGLAYYVLCTRIGFSTPVADERTFHINCFVQLAVVMILRILFGVYRNVWRYTSTRAYFRVLLSDAIAAVISVAFIHHISPLYGTYQGIWAAVFLSITSCLVLLASRITYRMLYKHSRDEKSIGNKKPVAIVGAGRLGVFLANDLRHNQKSEYDPKFFIDTDGTKVNNTVAELKVYAAGDAFDVIKKENIRDVIIAIAGKDKSALGDLYEIYSEAGCKVLIYEASVGKDAVPVGKIRDFSIEDILFRKPIEIGENASFYHGKVVLVTGGGGSIGSELCRQIAKFGPLKLIIFDIYENNAYEIQQELIRKYGQSLNLIVEIGSVRDRVRVEQLFQTYQPQLVFHAAAHKHVPLMEHSSQETVKNNVMGTKNVADMAEKYGAEKFILISTDKAVNPTNIMGASKRACEMVIQCRTDSKTSFAAVRFGNVLGSNGSVVPLFKKQIAEGGPVTITDKRIIRYFMTIPEAAQLVLSAGAMAKNGQLYVLDMGKPVKIYDLAVNMIRLSGLTPGEDIEIKEIGLRPGEKLYEELLIKTENMTKTDNNLIFVETDTPYTREEVDAKIAILCDAVTNNTSIKEAFRKVVPTYHDPEEVNKKASEAAEMKLSEERDSSKED